MKTAYITLKHKTNLYFYLSRLILFYIFSQGINRIKLKTMHKGIINNASYFFVKFFLKFLKFFLKELKNYSDRSLKIL
jgi:hypothetical protein